MRSERYSLCADRPSHAGEVHSTEAPYPRREAVEGFRRIGEDASLEVPEGIG